LQFTSLRDTKAELAATTSERDVLKSELESQLTSVRDTKAELAATASERDVLKGELESARRELDASRTKLGDVANQLVRLGQDLSDGAVTPKRPQPPPIPVPQPRAPTAPVVETLLVTEEAKPASRIGSVLFMLGGVIVGCALTIAIMKWGSSSTTDEVAAPSAPVAAPVLPPHNPAMRAEDVQPPPPAVDTPKQDSPPAITAPPTTNAADGVIVLPGSAAGHRVFVDGRLVEVKSSRASVPCGSHEVRIGSSGTVRKLDIACGGETALPEEPRDK